MKPQPLSSRNFAGRQDLLHDLVGRPVQGSNINGRVHFSLQETQYVS
jgi:hypothetical protein